MAEQTRDRNYRRCEPEVLARKRRNEDRFPGCRVLTLTPGGPRRHAERLVQSVSGHSPMLEAVLLPFVVTLPGGHVGRVAGWPGGVRVNALGTAARTLQPAASAFVLAVGAAARAHVVQVWDVALQGVEGPALIIVCARSSSWRR